MTAPERSERRGLSRRDMIKASAAAGAAAWTAPVIIDSLSSPAAAQTVVFTPGCHVICFNGNCSDDNNGTPCNNAPPCSTSGKCEPLNSCFAVSPSNGACGGDTQVTFTLNGTCGDTHCNITYASAKITGGGNTCDERTGISQKSVVFPVVSPNNYNQFVLFVTCT